MAELGLFASVYGAHPPHRLLEAMDVFRMEVNAVQSELARQRREEARDEAKKHKRVRVEQYEDEG